MSRLSVICIIKTFELVIHLQFWTGVKEWPAVTLTQHASKYKVQGTQTLSKVFPPFAPFADICIRFQVTAEAYLILCPSHTPARVLSWTCQSEGNDRADRGLILGRSEVLRSLRHYLRSQSQGHHNIDRLEESGVERGSARRSSLKGRERAIVNQTNIGTVSKATLGKLLRDGWSAHGLFRTYKYHLELNWI